MKTKETFCRRGVFVLGAALLLGLCAADYTLGLGFFPWEGAYTGFLMAVLLAVIILLAVIQGLLRSVYGRGKGIARLKKEFENYRNNVVQECINRLQSMIERSDQEAYSALQLLLGQLSYELPKLAVNYDRFNALTVMAYGGLRLNIDSLFFVAISNSSGSPDCLRTIASQPGFNINSVDSNSKTGLHIAIACHPKGVVKIVELLLEKGINTNAQSIEGNTALHLLARSQITPELKEQLTEMLVGAGADISIENNEGNTAEDILIECGGNSTGRTFGLMSGKIVPEAPEPAEAEQPAEAEAGLPVGTSADIGEEYAGPEVQPEAGDAGTAAGGPEAAAEPEAEAAGTAGQADAEQQDEPEAPEQDIGAETAGPADEAGGEAGSAKIVDGT